MSDADRLRAVIDASGLSQVAFARDVLAGRDPVTVRRWLAGRTMPQQVQDWLARVVKVERAGPVVRIEVLPP